MIAGRFRRSLPLYVVGAVAVLAGVALALALVSRGQDQQQLAEGRLANCLAIEEHKRFHREDATFDLRETRDVLRELGIDPASQRGERLIERGRRQSAREQARFAAADC